MSSLWTKEKEQFFKRDNKIIREAEGDVELKLLLWKIINLEQWIA